MPVSSKCSRLGTASDPIAVNAALADPTMRKKFADLGGMMLGGAPAEFGKFVAAETDKWAKVIHEANIALME